MDNLSRDELEHASIQAQLKIISADISINFKEIETNFKVLHAENRAEFDVIGATLKIIEKETKITNGRITKQEKVTEVLRVMSEHKWLTGGFLYGIFNILQLMTIENIISWIKFFI